MYSNKNTDDKSIPMLFKEVRQTIADLAEKINDQTIGSIKITNSMVNQINQLNSLTTKIDTHINDASTRNANILNEYKNINGILSDVKTSLRTITDTNNKLEFKLFKIFLYGTVIYTIVGLFFTLYQAGMFTISGG